jgi:hypothetical protein
MGRQRNAAMFYLSRFQRILIPYWIYALFCILITLAAKRIIHFEQEKIVSAGLPLLFSPVSNLPYITWSLWFVPVYLYVVLAFPLLKWYHARHENDAKKYIPLIIFAVLICNNGWEVLYEAKMTLFYCFWAYLGLFFKRLDWHESAKTKAKIAPIVVFCALAVLWFIQNDAGRANMQSNKFPPNIVFLVYTFGALSALYIFSKYIFAAINRLRKNRLFGWIYKQYIQNCYTVFLYHPLSFLILYVVLRYTGLKEYLFRNELICFFVYMILTIPMCAVAGKLFSWAEKIKINDRKGGL